MSRTMKKLSVIAFILLVLMLAVFGAAEAEAGKKLQIKIPLPKTRIQTQTEGTGTLKANAIQEGTATAKTCEPFTLTLSDKVINMGAAKYQYSVAIDDGTYTDNNVDTLYIGDTTEETTFQYTFYQTGVYIIFVNLLNESETQYINQLFYEVTVSEGTGDNPLKAKVNEAVSACKKDNEFDTAVAINDWLCAKVSYDNTFTYYSADAALLEGTCVCNGYCRAYELIATACGLQCDRALGTATSNSGATEDHAWNVVRMDDQWYQVDVTWNDNNDDPHHVYFGLTDDLMGLNHTLDSHPNGASYTCNSLEDNYFLGTGKWRTILAKDSIESVQSQINDGKLTIEAQLGQLYVDDGSGYCWSEDNAVFANIYGTVLAYAYTQNTWERANGDSTVPARGVFTYDNSTRTLTGTMDAVTTAFEDGVLTISGVGAMDNYDYDDPTKPWYSYADQITEVVIERGVTSIGDYAFYGCGKIEKLTIADTVESIGDCAFTICGLLKEVSFPDSVQTIGRNAFGMTGLENIKLPKKLTTIKNDCFWKTNLKSVEIPEGVTEIEDSAFFHCDELTTVTLPKSLAADQLGQSAFTYCNKLSEFVVPSDHPSLSFVDGAVIDTTKGRLIMTAPAAIQGDYTVPESVRIIGYNSFEGIATMSSIVFPSGMTEIERYAFAGCGMLSKVYIPDSVTTIAEDLGVNNFITVYCSMNSKAYEWATAQGVNCVVTDSPFSGATKIIRLPAGLTEIKAEAFEGTDGEVYIIPVSCKTIGSKAFAGLKGKQIRICINWHTENIADDAFEGSDVVFVMSGMSPSFYDYVDKHNIPVIITESWGNG